MSQQSFTNFLKSHTAGKGLPHTHTRIGCKEEHIFGASYYVPDDEYKQFMDLYYDYVIENGNEEYLTEKMLDNGIILVDFDFRYEHNITKRKHTQDHIIDMVMLYVDEINKLIEIPKDESYEVFVLEKPNVNILEDKTKDGIHMIICLNMQRRCQILLRDLVMEKLKHMWDDLPITNTWDNVIDEGIVKASCNWNMFGSCKPQNETYGITNHFIIKNNDYVLNSTPLEIKDIFYKISARYTGHKSFEIKNGITFKPIKTHNEDSGYSTPVNTPSVKVKKVDNYLDLLFNVIKNETKNNEKVINRSNGFWLKICGALLSNGYDKQVWLDYCNPQSNKKKDTASKLWDNFAENPRCVSIYALNVIADIVNPHGYKEWFIKNKEYISLKVLAKGENDIAKNVADKLSETIKFCHETWYIYDKKIKLWIIVKDPKSEIINPIQRRIDESKESLLWKINRSDDEVERKRLKDMEKKYDEFHTLVGRGSMATGIISYLKSELRDNEFYKKLDIKPFQVVYKNGILDLRTMLFKEGLEANDFLTHYIDYDYREGTQEEMDWVKEQLKKICNYDDKHLDYYLSTFGYSMTGDSSRKQEFYCLRGQGAENGKSIIFEALSEIIPNYIGKLESKIFETTYTARHKPIAKLGGKRIVWINELSKKKQESEIIKEVSDGKPLEFKIMFGTMGQMPVCFKLFIVGNHTIKYDDDNGMNRRLNIMQFDSDFSKKNKVNNYENKTFIRNENFCNDLSEKYKYGFMSLIYQYSKMYIDDGYNLKPFPEKWSEETQTTILDNNKFKEFFDDNFDIDANATISKESVDDILNEYKGGAYTFKDELKKMKIEYDYDSQTRFNGCNKKGIWKGFKKAEIPNVTEE